ncbi:hypothetical protein COV20_03880 [Candidatus Woesearchaeota archaeon CG10_big_fil_rev_8_21_14_0_10_45_16]|nr:MAG: hypothetical protein COV20_03880 [Candidatus Woesearchaeota archaeon CG10_big_fil_rev_8_21_14_0_10_45_16]
MSSYFRKAVRSTGISLLMVTLAAIVSYITRIYLARLLGPEEYGLFYAVFTFVIFFLFIRDLGLDQSLVKFIAAARVRGSKGDIMRYLTTTIAWQLLGTIIMSGVFILGSSYLAVHYFKDSRASIILLLLVIYIFSSIFFRVQKQMFQAFQKMFLYSSVELLKNVLVFLLVIAFLPFVSKVYAPLFAYVLIGPLLTLVYLIPFLKVSPRLTISISQFKETSKEMLAYGIPVLFTSASGAVIGYIDTIILTFFVSLSDVGIYNVVLPTAIIILSIGRSLSSVVFPMSSELWEKRDLRRLYQGLNLIHQYVLIALLPLIIVLFFQSEFIIGALFGQEYQSGALAFQILLLGVMIYILVQSNNSILAGMGKTKAVMKVTMISAAANTILNLLLIPSFGIIGAAFTTTFSYYLSFFMSTKIVYSSLQKKLPLKKWSKILAVAFISFAIAGIVVNPLLTFLFGSGWLTVLLSIMIMCLFCFILSLSFKIFNFAEIKRMGRRVFSKKTQLQN